MKSVLPAGSLGRKILGIGAAQILLLGVIGAGVSYQVRWVEQKITDMADLKDPSPFTARLVEQLNIITLNLLQSMHLSDAPSAQRIRGSEKEFENSIVEFQQLNPRLFPASAEAKILGAYGPFKDTLQNILDTRDTQAGKWGDLLDNNDEIAFWLEHRLRPIVKMNQRMAVARLDLILNLENLVHAIPKDLTQYILRHTGATEPQMDQSDQKFEALLRLYEHIAPLSRERQGLDRIDRLWADNVSLAQEVLQLENTKDGDFNALLQASQTLQNTISEALPAVRPEVIEQKKNAILHSITLIVVFAGLMLLAGLATSIGSGLWIYRQLRCALEEIRRLAEAAATGDLSHNIATEESQEWGGVAQSVNHLVGALRRSEQLNVQLGTIVESTGDACVGSNLEGTILSWNRGAQRMYGYRAEDVKGKSIDLLFASSREVLGLLNKMRQTQQATLDCVHVRKGGAKIQVHATLNRILDSSGRSIGLTLLVREGSVSSTPLSQEIPSTSQGADN